MIYFIEYANLIKIGYASNVEKRLNSFKTLMPTFNIIGTMEGTRGHERTIHDCLAPHKHGREWFTDCPQVRSFIAEAVRDGVTEWKNARTRNHVNSEWDIKAHKLVAVITDGKSVDDFPKIGVGLGLDPNFLWRMTYRQTREVSVGEYYSLVRAASSVIEIRRSALERQADFVRSLEIEDADKDNRLIDAERGYRAAQALVRKTSET